MSSSIIAVIAWKKLQPLLASIYRFDQLFIKEVKIFGLRFDSQLRTIDNYIERGSSQFLYK